MIPFERVDDLRTQRNFELIARLFTVLSGIQFFIGTGDPNGQVTADSPAIYFNYSGGAGTTMYVKESGTGDTGWVGK